MSALCGIIFIFSARVDAREGGKGIRTTYIHKRYIYLYTSRTVGLRRRRLVAGVGVVRNVGALRQLERAPHRGVPHFLRSETGGVGNVSMEGSLQAWGVGDGDVEGGTSKVQGHWMRHEPLHCTP